MVVFIEPWRQAATISYAAEDAHWREIRAVSGSLSMERPNHPKVLARGVGDLPEDVPGGVQSGVHGTAAAEGVEKSRRMALLTRVVATEILPRLAFARQAADGVKGLAEWPLVNDRGGSTTQIDTGELVRLLLRAGADDAVAFIETLLTHGVTAEALYVGILPDAARWLGLMWEEDRCDFAQVTIALGRLQQVARLVSPRFQAAATKKSGADSLLLLPAPGEQHSFGLLILAEFFERAGWRVAGGPKSTGIDAAEMARQAWFDIAGFSIGSERFLDDLARTIRRVRRASRNRGLCVLVGGPLLRERPELAAVIGADAMAMDPPAALRVATDLLTMRAAAE